MAISVPDGFHLNDETTFAIDTGEIYDQTDDGATRIRDVYGDVYYVIGASYGPLTIAEANQLIGFFITNKGAEFTIPVDGVDYTCVAVSSPIRSGAGVSRSVSIAFRGTANA